MSKTIHISSFYRFTPLTQAAVLHLKDALEGISAHTGLRGLVLIGAEGINSTLSGTEAALAEAKALVAREASVGNFKDSVANRHPFNYFRVKIKDEIVTMGQPGVVPPAEMNFHLSPEQWNEAMQDPDVVVLDTRNTYETDLGKFKGAVDLRISEFSEFPERVKAEAIPKDKKVLMYCTGGIRCEKAILAMHEQGYENVYQLQGGILEYLKEFPEQQFEGECFVFDYRVAVDQKLQPTSKYKLCPHCGQPALTKITCGKCAREEVICTTCFEEGGALISCSKNCAHHLEIGSGSTKGHQQEMAKRRRL